MEQLLSIVRHSFHESAGLIGFWRAFSQRCRLASECSPNLSKVGTPARNDSNADDIEAQRMQPVARRTTHDKLTAKGALRNRLRFCHTLLPLSVTDKQRFKSSK
jgi:hypothetical protein